MEGIEITMIPKKDLEHIFDKIKRIEMKLKPNPLDNWMTVDGLVEKFPHLKRRNVIYWINTGKVEGKRIGKDFFVNVKSMGLV